MPDGRLPPGVTRERRSLRSRIRRRLARIPHPSLPGFLLRRVAYVRLTILLLLLTGSVGYAVFRAPRFQDLMRRRSQATLRQLTGREVVIGGFDLRLLPPAFVVKNVRVANDGRGLSGDCFSAAEVEIRGVPELGADRIDIRRIRLISPRVVFEVFEDGTNNFSTILAALPRSDGQGGLDVRLGEAVLQDATIRFREWKAQLDVVLQGAVLSARSQWLSKVTTASLACRRARFRLEDNKVLDFGLALEAVLSPGRVHIASLRVRSDRIRVDASGGVNDLRQPVLTLRATASTTGRALNELFSIGLPLEGGVATSGVIRVTPSEGFRIRGRFEIPGGRMGPFPMSGTGFIRVDPGGLLAHVERGSYAGGNLEALVRVERLRDPPLPVRIVARGRGLDMESFFGDIDLAGTGLRSRADLDTTLTFGARGIEHADGVGRLTLAAEPGTPSHVRGRHALPTSGGGPLHVRDGRITFASFPLLTSGGARIGLDGTLSLGTWVPDLSFDLSSADLSEVERIADNFYAAINRTPLLPKLRLQGSGRFQGTIRRSFGNPLVEANLGASRFWLHGVPFGEVAADVFVDGRVARFDPFLARDDNAGLTLKGRIGWGGDLGDHYRLEDLVVDVERWPLERILEFLDFDLPLEGPITGRLPVNGLTPDLEGSAPVDWGPAVVWGQPFDRVEGLLQLQPDRISLSGVSARLGEGRLRGDGTYRYADRGYRFAVEAEDLPTGRLKAVTDTADLTAVLTGSMRGDGSLAAPRIHLEGGLREVRWAGRPVGSGREMALRAEVNGDDWEATVESPGEASLTGRSDSRSSAGQRYDLRVSSLSGYAELLSIPSEAQLEGDFQASLRLLPGAPEREREGEGRLSSSGIRVYGRRVEVPETTFLLKGPRVTFAGLVLHAHLPDAGGGSAPSSARVSGTITASEPRSFDLAVTGSLEAALLDPLLSGGRLSGRVTTDAKVGGTPERPVFSGRLFLDGVDYRGSVGAVPFESITGIVQLTAGSASVNGLTMGFSGGRIDLTGGLELEGLNLSAIRLGAHLQAVKNEPFPGFRATVTGDLVLTGDQTIRQASGELSLVRGVYSQDLDIGLGTLLARFRPDAEISPAPGPFDGVLLDTRILVPSSAIEVRNNLARFRASGELQARGTFGRPVLFGTLEAQEGGRLVLRNQRYDLVRGRMIFSNPQRIDPFLEVEAETTIKQWDVSFSLSGTLLAKDSRLVPKFSSDPPLPEAQVVSLVLTGELPGTNSLGVTTGTSVVSDDQSIYNATRQLITSLATDALAGRTKELFRLDRLQIDPVFVGSSFDAPRVTIGKALSKDLTVTYSYKASTTQEQIILVEYQLSSRAYVQMARDENGIYSVDVRFRQQLR